MPTKVKVTNTGGAPQSLYDEKHASLVLQPGETKTLVVKNVHATMLQKSHWLKVEVLEEDEDEDDPLPGGLEGREDSGEEGGRQPRRVRSKK